ncbi:hypothetical protein [Plantibacter sp. ME-Dv--P-122b]|uniref:hypothetical protein n=1 Tax=Plantibacter sp. ME-Dv--P-122b TaxID=3040300 RepID=UPI00254D35AA|nr:hypothetical protein [Plantibacter sp. ME-Dv--P-122b]
MGESRGARARRNARRAIAVGLGAITAAVLLTGCGSSADADGARASLVEAVEGLPDVADVTGTVEASNGGGLETYYSARITVEMAGGAPPESYTGVAAAAAQATDGKESGELIIEDAAGGSVRFDTGAPAKTIDATVTAWRDWAADTDPVEVDAVRVASVEVELIAIAAHEIRPASSELKVLFLYDDPLTPTDAARLLGGFQAELPKPLASAETSLVLTNLDPGSAGAHVLAWGLPVPASVLETIAAIEGTTAVLAPLGGSVAAIDWYAEQRGAGSNRPDQLNVSVVFPEDTPLGGMPFAELQASPQWAAYQQVTTLANASETAISFTMSADNPRIAGFTAQPCGTADDELDAPRDPSEADRAIAAWWLAQAPACPGVGRHE